MTTTTDMASLMSGLAHTDDARVVASSASQMDAGGFALGLPCSDHVSIIGSATQSVAAHIHTLPSTSAAGVSGEAGGAALDAIGFTAASVDALVPMALDGAATGGDALPSVAIASAEGVSVAAEILATAAPLKEFGYWPQEFLIQGLEAVHVATGQPYWLTIIGVTIALRTAMLPVALLTMRNASRMAVMNPELKIIMDRVKV